jgi:hypothetical protein
MAALCNQDFGKVVATARETHSVSGPFTIGGTKNIAATAVIPCNETPIAGDVAYEHAIEFLWQAYQSAGDIPPDANPPTAINLAGIVYGSTFFF